MQVALNVSGGQLPARVVAVGFADGGALARLAATFAAGAWPQAQVRCITFGAQRLGDRRCAAVWPENVCLFALWPVWRRPSPRALGCLRCIMSGAQRLGDCRCAAAWFCKVYCLGHSLPD